MGSQQYRIKKSPKDGKKCYFSVKCLSFFRRLEDMRNWRLAEDPSHGVGGPIAVEDGLRSRLSMFKIIVINNR